MQFVPVSVMHLLFVWATPSLFVYLFTFWIVLFIFIFIYFSFLGQGQVAVCLFIEMKSFDVSYVDQKAEISVWRNVMMFVYLFIYFNEQYTGSDRRRTGVKGEIWSV